MKKKVLIIALNENWTGISRLPYGLDRAGFEVFSLCPKKSLIAKTKFLKGSILYPTFTYSRSKFFYLWIVYAILTLKPQVVLPGDEETILAMQNVANLTKNIPFLGFVSTLLRQTMSPEEFDSITLSKSEFQEKCKEWGIRTPQNIIVRDLVEARAAAKKMLFPLVVKHDSGYGGSGVCICENEEELTKYFQIIEKVSLVTVLKNQVKRIFFITILSAKQSISLQQYIEGVVGIAPFCADKGEVFASNSMLKIRTFPGKTGPTAVAEGIDNKEIEAFSEIVAQKLEISGFSSLDFIIDSKSGLPYVIEINPRPTPSCHIGEGHIVNDLCEIYFKGLNGIPLIKNNYFAYTIAMYPGEKRRDPQSNFLKTAYHDVPVNDPDLFDAIESLYL